MKSSISTKVRKVNFKEIIENITDKRNWERITEIFKYGDCSVILSLSRIDVISSKIQFQLAFSSKLTKGNVENTFEIPLSIENYNEEVINNKLCTRVIEGFSEVGRRETLVYDTAYYGLDSLEEELAEHLEEIATDYLDENNITNEHIRDNYIENFIEDNTFKDLRWSYVVKKGISMFVPAKVSFCMLMGNKAKAEEVRKLRDKNKEKLDELISEIKSNQKEIEEMIENDNFEVYEELLDEI